MKDKITLKGNGSFYIREGWLTKGLVEIAKNPELFSKKNNEGADALGVGSAMSKSIRYWLLTAGLIDASLNELIMLFKACFNESNFPISFILPLTSARMITGSGRDWMLTTVSNTLMIYSFIWLYIHFLQTMHAIKCIFFRSQCKNRAKSMNAVFGTFFVY